MIGAAIAPRVELSEPGTGPLVVLVWDAADERAALRIARQAVRRYIVGDTGAIDSATWRAARHIGQRLQRAVGRDERGAIAYVA